MVLRKKWRAGDFLRKCERTGFTVYASDTRKEWTGHFVREKSWEPRHQQDFVRGIPDYQAAPEARPQPPTLPSVGPTVTSLATSGAAGATVLTVAATEGLSAGNTVQIVTDGGAHRTTISSIGANAAITISTPLPTSAPNKAAFMDITATTTATDNY